MQARQRVFNDVRPCGNSTYLYCYSIHLKMKVNPIVFADCPDRAVNTYRLHYKMETERTLWNGLGKLYETGCEALTI